LVSHATGRTEPKGVSECGAERKFGPKLEELTGGWRKLYNEELQTCAPGNIFR
jgi:hypothetical protein